MWVLVDDTDDTLQRTLLTLQCWRGGKNTRLLKFNEIRSFWSAKNLFHLGQYFVFGDRSEGQEARKKVNKGYLE